MRCSTHVLCRERCASSFQGGSSSFCRHWYRSGGTLVNMDLVGCRKSGPGPGPSEKLEELSQDGGRRFQVCGWTQLWLRFGRAQKPAAAPMEGAHTRQRLTAGNVLGDRQEADAQRDRVQCGAAATGRRGQAILIAAACNGSVPATVRKDVARAMQAGSALVQASLEHLQTAERSLGTNGFWTTTLLLSTATQPRCRWCCICRRCRGCGSEDDWRSEVRGAKECRKAACAITIYVAEMANNLWTRKYPASAELQALERKQYWSSIFTAYGAMYASGLLRSQPIQSRT